MKNMFACNAAVALSFAVPGALLLGLLIARKIRFKELLLPTLMAILCVWVNNLFVEAMTNTALFNYFDSVLTISIFVVNVASGLLGVFLFIHHYKKGRITSSIPIYGYCFGYTTEFFTICFSTIYTRIILRQIETGAIYQTLAAEYSIEQIEEIIMQYSSIPDSSFIFSGITALLTIIFYVEIYLIAGHYLVNPERKTIIFIGIALTIYYVSVSFLYKLNYLISLLFTVILLFLLFIFIQNKGVIFIGGNKNENHR